MHVERVKEMVSFLCFSVPSLCPLSQCVEAACVGDEFIAPCFDAFYASFVLFLSFLPFLPVWSLLFSFRVPFSFVPFWSISVRGGWRDIGQ